jgi:circadian clock protein KaiC
MDLSNFTVSFLADDIVRLRYVSINGQLRKMLLVVKMRRAAHSIDMVEYQITPKGIAIGQPLRGYRALTSGIPGWEKGGPWSPDPAQRDPAPRAARPRAPKKKPRGREPR